MSKIRGLRWWMIWLIMLGSVINYLTRSTLSVAAPTLLEDLHIGTEQYSWVVGTFQGAIMLLPLCGYVLDVIGLKRGYALFAAAWSSNPENPPLSLDLPTKAGQSQPDVLAKWAANAPLAFIDQYIGNLRRYRAIAMDVGDKDGLRIDTGKLHEVLDKYGVANSFEVYQGTHTSAVAVRFQNHVLPFFSKNLCFGNDCK